MKPGVIAERLDKIETMIAELTDITTKRLDEMDKRLSDLAKSQKLLSDQHDNFKITTDNFMKDNLKMRKELEDLQGKIKQSEKHASSAMDAVNDLEQYGRRDMIEISGIPRETDEQVEDMVVNMFHKIGLQSLNNSDIDASHRISKKDNASIIVKFRSRKIREMAFNLRANLKNKHTHDLGIALHRAPARLFINESLSRSNKSLFSEAHVFRKLHGIKYLWTKNGKVFMRRTDSSNIILIKSSHDLSIENINK